MTNYMPYALVISLMVILVSAWVGDKQIIESTFGSIIFMWIAIGFGLLVKVILDYRGKKLKETPASEQSAPEDDPAQKRMTDFGA